MFLPIWLVSDFRNLLHDPETGDSVDINSRILGLLVLDGLLNWLQNIIAFSVLSIVTPLTYAVASASKRIFVIAVTLLVLGNPVTGLNIFGMTMAILGVLSYNKAKYDQRHANKKTTVLPQYKGSVENGRTNFMVNGWAKDSHRLYAV